MDEEFGRWRGTLAKMLSEAHWTSCLRTHTGAGFASRAHRGRCHRVSISRTGSMESHSSKGFRRFPSVWLLVRSKCFTVNIYSFGRKKKTRRFLKIEPMHGLTLPPTSNGTSSRSNSSSRRCLLNSACGGTQLVSGPESLSSARASVESGVNRIGEVTKVHVRLCCCHSAFRLNDFQ